MRTCTTPMTVSGKVASVSRRTTLNGVIMTVRVERAMVPARYWLRALQAVPEVKQHVEITGFHAIGDPDVNMRDARVVVA